MGSPATYTYVETSLNWEMGGSWKNFQELDRGKSNKSPLTD